MINRYYKVFELIESTDDDVYGASVIKLKEMYEGEQFPSKAQIKRRLDQDINDSTREFVIEEVFTVDN